MNLITQNLIRRLSNLFIWLWRQKGTPSQRARGIAVGVFSGCFPFFGFQTLIGISLASLVRGNQLLAMAGTWISNPFTYIPLYWFNYKVGTVLLGESRNLQELHQFTRQELWGHGWLFSSRILLGSSLVGIISGLFVGLSSYIFLKLYSSSKFS